MIGGWFDSISVIFFGFAYCVNAVKCGFSMRYFLSFAAFVDVVTEVEVVTNAEAIWPRLIT